MTLRRIEIYRRAGWTAGPFEDRTPGPEMDWSLPDEVHDLIEHKRA